MARNKIKGFSLIDNLNHDHMLVLKSLRKLENRLNKPQRSGELKKATEFLNEIKGEMNIHFQKEEEILFPALNQHFEKALKKMDKPIRPEGGPVNVMFLEHKSMRMIIQNLEHAIKNAEGNEISAFIAQFGALLRSHIFREENVLYIVADAKLKEKEKMKIAKRFQILSKKHKNEIFI